MNAVLDWLLERENPSVRYFALRALLDRPEDDADVRAARQDIMASPPIRAILAAQSPEGYWAKAGTSYTPKYQSTVWQVLFLAELGADGADSQIGRGCEYLLAHTQAPNGGLSALQGARPGGVVYCLNGNLIGSLIALGYGHDPRVQRALDWLVKAITSRRSDGATVSGLGPGFRCSANDGLPCAWGVVKSLRALAAVPADLRSEGVAAATTCCVDFLLSRDLAQADYPYRERVSGEWFKFGFPLSYTSDVLEALLALAEVGKASDPRLSAAIELLRSKRGSDGRWIMQHSLNKKMWADIEKKGKPSKWVTLRALRVLKAAGLN